MDFTQSHLAAISYKDKPEAMRNFL